MVLKEKNLHIKKHSALIQISGNNLSLVQKKAFSGLLYFARAQKAFEPQRSVFEIPYCSLKELCNISSPNNKELHSHLEGLMGIVVRPNFLNKDKTGKWNAFSLLSGAEESENNSVLFSFPHQIENSLVSPEIYSLINIGVTRKLTNKYSVTLYELLFDYKNVSFPTLTIPQFRELMGISKNKYLQFKELNKSVIKRAINEINKKTDMQVKFDVIKKGRNIDKISFSSTMEKIEKNIDKEFDEEALSAIKALSAGKGVAYHALLVNKFLAGDPGTVIAITNYISENERNEELNLELYDLKNKYLNHKVFIENEKFSIIDIKKEEDSFKMFLSSSDNKLYEIKYLDILPLLDK